MRPSSNRWIVAPLIILAVAILLLHLTGWSAPVRAKIFGGKTITDQLNEYGPSARARLKPFFERADVSFPPPRVMLVGLKAEKRLEVYAADATGPMRWIRSYPILAASGVAGPKLRRGDKQVPEGIYSIESLNPNSRFHLSLRVSYPNDFDCKMAAADGRTDLGSDIMIHGSNVSVGCLAMGDEAAEDLFVLAADTGIENVAVMLAPQDFRKAAPASAHHHAWITELYDRIARLLAELPPPH